MREFEDNVGRKFYPLMLSYAKIQIYLKYKKTPKMLLMGLPDQNIKDKTKTRGTPPPTSMLTKGVISCAQYKGTNATVAQGVPLEPTGLPGLVFQEWYKIE